MKIAIYTLFASLLISMTSCLEEISINEFDIQQSISYVENNWEYHTLDTIYFGDNDTQPLILHRDFTGYVLITTTSDFSFTDKGSYEFIDSMKCVRLTEIRELQIDINKIRYKSCESNE